MTSKITSTYEYGQDPLWPNPWHFSPTRRIPRSAVAITGAMVSAKMSCQVLHESLAEKRVFEIIDQAAAPWCFLPQPLHVPLADNAGWYTPDALLIFRPPCEVGMRIKPLLLEVKPYDLIGRWVRENGDRVAAAANLAEHHGWGYFIVPDPKTTDEQQRLATWIDKWGRSAVRDDVPLRGHIVRSLGFWNGMPTRTLVRRLRYLGVQDQLIIDALNPLILEGVLEVSRDRYGCQFLQVSRVPRQVDCFGSLS